MTVSIKLNPGQSVLFDGDCYTDIVIVSHNQTLKLLYSVISDLDAKSIWESINFENGKLVRVDGFESKSSSNKAILV